MTVQSNRLLQSLPPEELSAIERVVVRVAVAAGSTLQDRGQPARHVHFPQSGIVALLTDAGEERILTGMVGYDRAIGAHEALANGYSAATAIAHSRLTSWRIDSDRFRAVIAVAPALRDIVARHAISVLAEAQQTAACNAVHSADQRLARWLMRMDDLERAAFPLTQEQFSEMLGVQRATISMAASRLKKLGLVDYRRGKFFITNRAGIEACACQCHQAVHGAYPVAPASPSNHSPFAGYMADA